tara:strand:+ start:1224 stop:1484 length:261 start_codon:yes stop_codon:yes gene_type:complete
MRIETKKEVEQRILKKTGLTSVIEGAGSPKISLETDNAKNFIFWRERLAMHRKNDSNLKKFYSESMSRYEIGLSILKNLRSLKKLK